MVLVYGKGKTGEAVKRFLDSKNIQNTVVDDSDELPDLKDIDYIVVSPGVPFYHNLYKLARKNKIPIISEIELAHRYFVGKKIAITGTDGKTTTTSLIYHILKDWQRSFIVGNYGIPFVNIVDDADANSTAVLELSSFQLYSTHQFRPDIAIILNISKDHLDWHKKMCHYILSKAKITKNQTENQHLILNFDDPILSNIKSKAQQYYFSLHKLPDSVKGIYLVDRKKLDGLYELTFCIKTNKEISFKTRTKLIGLHNVQNIMASTLACYLHGVDVEYISNKLEIFEPLPHRIEFVRDVKGIKFYNDSKATTVQAVMKAVESFDEKIVLIMGGVNKGGDFSALGSLLRDRVKKVFLIGKSKDEIEQMIKDYCLVEKVDSLEEAVKRSFETAEKSEVVLLSPGCASFDMFKSYVDRGEQFKHIVSSLYG